MSQLRIENVTKFYGKHKALDSFTATFENGIHGILGPNGAGKTTLINVITKLLGASDGQVYFDDENILSMGRKYLSKIGYMPQYPQFYPNFTAYQMMKYMAALKNIKDDNKIKELLSFVNLSNDADKKVGAYSGGMRQRLAVACAMINDPALLIFDEPTAGLDPKERMRFRSTVSEIAENRIVLISTHIISDIEYMADDVVLLGDGRLMERGTPTELCEKLKGKVYNVSAKTEKEVDEASKLGVVSSISHENEYNIRLISDNKMPENAVPTSPMLDDVFLYYFADRKE